jgi:predicted RNase H-like HicB family nuclease
MTEAHRYHYLISWNDEDKLFIGSVAEFPSLKTHGDSGEEALKEIQNLVTEVLQDLKEDEEHIPQPVDSLTAHGAAIISYIKDRIESGERDRSGSLPTRATLRLSYALIAMQSVLKDLFELKETTNGN